jgi:dipeptidase E
MAKVNSNGRRILLISNSTQHGSGYLDHCAQEIADFLAGAQPVLFFPYALYDRQAYAAKAKGRLAVMGLTLHSVTDAPDAQEAVAKAKALFIGGGNTFRLLKSLYDANLLDAIRRRVDEGIPYIGSSAGSIVAGLTIKTTKDMPIVQPPSFDALGLVPFQISPHYLDPDPHSTHMGETQEERILQFLEENDAPVVGLREGGILRCENGSVRLKGVANARLFRRCQAPVEVERGASLDEFLRGSAA